MPKIGFKRALAWNSQPQEAVVLNADHPLAPYCVGGWVSSQAGVLVRVGGVQGLTRSGTTQEVNRQGFGTRFGSSYAATDIISLPNTDEQKFIGQNATVIAGVTAGTLVNSQYPTIWAIRNTSTLVAAFFLAEASVYTGGRVVLNLGGAEIIGTSGSARQNEYAVYGAQWGTEGRRLYVNGALDATSTNNAQIVSAAVQPSLGNRQAGGRPLNGVLHWWLGFNINIGDDWHALIAQDPWQLFEPRRIFVPVSAGGGSDVTVNLSGISAAFAQTSPVTSSTVALSGESATASAGIVLPAFSAALSGQAIVAAAGGLSSSTSCALSSQSATFAAGSVVPSVAIAVIGLQATFAAGTLTASSSGGDTAALTGEVVSFAQTAPSVSVTIALTGIAATMSAGILSASSGTATITVKAGSWLRYKKLQ